MKKRFKCRAQPFILAAILSIAVFLGMGKPVFATQAPPTGVSADETVIVMVPASYSSTAKALSAYSITFQTVDSANWRAYPIKKLQDYSFWGTNDPSFVGNSFANSWKWQPNRSRITIAKLFKVTGGSYVTFVVANEGEVPEQARICVAEYDSSYKLITDGEWHKATDKIQLQDNTRYVACILRYDNGTNAIGSGQKYTAGYSTDWDYWLNLGFHDAEYFVFKPFKYYVDLNGDGTYENTVERWGINSVWSTFKNYSTTKPGYTFTGWDVGTASGKSDVAKNISTAELEEYLSGGKYYGAYFKDLCFKANYTPNTFTIYYHSSDTAAASSTTTKVTYGTSTATKTISELGFSKAGYTFAGWKVYREVDGKYYVQDANGNNG